MCCVLGFIMVTITELCVYGAVFLFTQKSVSYVCKVQLHILFSVWSMDYYWLLSHAHTYERIKWNRLEKKKQQTNSFASA